MNLELLRVSVQGKKHEKNIVIFIQKSARKTYILGGINVVNPEPDKTTTHKMKGIKGEDNG